MKIDKGDLYMTYNFGDFLNRLKKSKSEKKLRVEDISRISNVPIGTVSKIFAGITTDPKISTVISIAESLNVSIDYLIYGKRETGLREEESYIIKKYRQLNTDDQEEVDAILDVKLAKTYRKSAEKEGLA